MDDLIDRQAAIDELEHAAWGKEWDKALVKAMLESLPSEQQWISVEKETPILPNIVLVCDSLGKILFDSYIDGSWTYCPYVVAWMPLPEPYKEETNG